MADSNAWIGVVGGTATLWRVFSVSVSGTNHYTISGNLTPYANGDYYCSRTPTVWTNASAEHWQYTLTLEPSNGLITARLRRSVGAASAPASVARFLLRSMPRSPRSWPGSIASTAIDTTPNSIRPERIHG